MTKFLFESEGYSKEECRALGDALSPLAESDLPLLSELFLVSEEEIRALNARERGVDAVTDVLSFPSMEGIRGEFLSSDEHGECVETTEENGAEQSTLFLGSVVVCEKRAREQAEEYGHSYDRERFYLAVHGVLHCLGYDHMNEEEKAEMRRREEEVMERIGLGREQ